VRESPHDSTVGPSRFGQFASSHAKQRSISGERMPRRDLDAATELSDLRTARAAAARRVFFSEVRAHEEHGVGADQDGAREARDAQRGHAGDRKGHGHEADGQEEAEDLGRDGDRV